MLIYAFLTLINLLISQRLLIEQKRWLKWRLFRCSRLPLQELSFTAQFLDALISVFALREKFWIDFLPRKQLTLKALQLFLA